MKRGGQNVFIEKHPPKIAYIIGAQKFWLSENHEFFIYCNPRLI